MKTSIREVELKTLTETEHNPRQISKKDFETLKKSLKEFPEMQEIREIVVDENMTILGGHQRVKAMMANGQEKATVKIVEGLTDEQKREFARYPKYRENYLRSFDVMWKNHIDKGLTGRGWKCGQDIFNWWIGDNDPEEIDDLTLFDDDI